MLLLEEGQLLSEEQCPGMGVIQSRKRVLTFRSIERVLRPGIGIAAAKGAEDLADVVQVFAEGLTAPHG